MDRYKGYTEIQKVAIPIIKRGDNCIVIAATGAGKTEAAVLPLIEKVLDTDKVGIKILYITPLRALNRDMVKRLEGLCNQIGITIAVRHGDTKASERSKQARHAPIFLITTPETLQSILPTKTIGAALRNVKAVVVDEIHELYYNKRGAQLSLALERLEELAPNFQRIGISATVGDSQLVKNFLCDERECKIAKVDTNKAIEVHVELPKFYDSKLKPLEEKFGLNDESLARLDKISGLV